MHACTSPSCTPRTQVIILHRSRHAHAPISPALLPPAHRYLVDQGLADPKRLAIDGGSAGGYTTLGALAFRDVFTAGCSLYGVADLGALAADTHKFESRYLDGLVGRYPEDKAIYEERAPINSVDTLSCPILLLQVPPATLFPKKKPGQAQSPGLVTSSSLIILCL